MITDVYFQQPYVNILIDQDCPSINHKNKLIKKFRNPKSKIKTLSRTVGMEKLKSNCNLYIYQN